MKLTGYAPLDLVLDCLSEMGHKVAENVNIYAALGYVVIAEFRVLPSHPSFDALVAAAAHTLVDHADEIFTDPDVRADCVLVLNISYPR